MSYTSDLKETIIHESNHSLEELAGFIHGAANLHLRGRGVVGLSFTSDKNFILRHFYESLKAFTKEEIHLEKTKEISERYQLRLEDATSLLETLGVLREGSLHFDVDMVLIDNERKRREFIKGVFIATGVMSDPTKDYHLEMSYERDDFVEAMIHILSPYDLEFLRAKRRDRHILYLKKSESIMDFLTIIGAVSSALDFENTRIIKSVKNDVNRQVNCETANINKTVSAARKHLDAIEYISQKVGLDSLTDVLREVAQKRLDEPELSLKEIGEMCDPPISKSGVNHRLERILKICEKLKETP